MKSAAPTELKRSLFCLIFWLFPTAHPFLSVEKANAENTALGQLPSPPLGTPTPADRAEGDRLAKAFALLEAQKFAAAEDAFQSLSGEAETGNWALLGQALSQHGLMKNSDSLVTLKRISEKHPASLDARVLRLRIGNGEENARVTELKNELRALGREDLLTVVLKVDLERALASDKSRDVLSLYRELRPRLRKHHALPLGLGRDEATALAAAMKKHFQGKALAEFLLFEAEQLYADRKIDRCLETLRDRQKHAPEDAKSIILKAKALRAAGRAEEANAILEKKSANVARPEAAAVLLELSRVLWNQNKNEAARRHAVRFLKEFPNADTAEEVQHIAAHTWIGEGDWDHGLDELKKLAGRNTASDYSALAERDLAWLNFRRGALDESSKWFEKYLETVRRRRDAANGDIRPRERAKKLRDAQFEEEHAKFWSAETCKLRREKEANATCTGSPEERWKQLAASSPTSYYGLLSSLRLGITFPPQALVNDGTTSAKCGFFTAPEFERALQQLRDQRLHQLVSYELRWFLKGASPAYLSAAFPSSDSPSEWSAEQVERSMCVILLFSKFGEHSAALPIAELLLKNNTKIVTPVERAYSARAAFPFPFRENYMAEGAKWNMPPALALAISRTESHFDPSARSTSDARGLMQLLPKTAAHEGLRDSELLFDPIENIQVGVKHLSGLLSYFKNEDLAAGAYNAGREALNRWKVRTTTTTNGVSNDLERLGMDAWVETIPYAETRNYIKKVRLAKRWYSTLYRELSDPTKSAAQENVEPDKPSS